MAHRYRPEEEDGDDPELTLESIQHNKKINLSIRANYTNWAPREGFRELAQNWLDGIIVSFQLAEKDFRVEHDEKKQGRATEIVYKVIRNADNECLGYIRFYTKDDDSAGTIELTNRNAKLEPCHLDLGATSKANDSRQAGAHGEGLKLALLVLMRGPQNYSVRCRSAGFNWYFNFNNHGRLFCHLYRMSGEAIDKAVGDASRLAARTLLPFAADPRWDVQFIIGETPTGRTERNERGAIVQRRGVTRQEFDEFTKAALFLQGDLGDGAICAPNHGHLLTDPRLRGNIYLKRLLLAESTPERSASITSQPLKYGYNFAHGKTNRERQSLLTAREEEKAIMAIWRSVLDARPDMAAELSAMLNDPTPHPYADVSGAKRHIGLEMATVLRDYLKGQPFAGKWYYSGEDKAQNPRLQYIIEGLGYEGVELTKTYWSILRGHKLLRTAEEEEQQRFMAAPLIPDTDAVSTFADSVRRLLRACGHACSKTKGMAFHFVQAGQLHLQLFYSEFEGLFRVHGRWLSARSAIEELGLPDDLAEDDAVFHTVTRLFSDALEQLPLEVFDAGEANGVRTNGGRRKQEMSRTEQRLLTYSRLVGPGIRVVPEADGLVVTSGSGWWLDASSGGSDSVVEIQCHKASSCDHLRSKLLTAEDAHIDEMVCLSPEARVGCRVWYRDNHRGGGTRLDDLENGEEYFVVLATPGDPDSFVGISSVVRWACTAPPSPSGSDLTPSRRSTAGLRHSSTPSRRSTPGLPGFSTASRPFTAGPPESPGSPSPNTQPNVPSPQSDNVMDPVPFSSPSPLPPNPNRSIFTTPARPPPGSPMVDHSQRPKSFVTGPRLDSLDSIFEVGQKKWYEGRSDDNTRAVIGILPGKNTLSKKSRKRVRFDQD